VLGIWLQIEAYIGSFQKLGGSVTELSVTDVSQRQRGDVANRRLLCTDVYIIRRSILKNTYVKLPCNWHLVPVTRRCR